MAKKKEQKVVLIKTNKDVSPEQILKIYSEDADLSFHGISKLCGSVESKNREEYNRLVNLLIGGTVNFIIKLNLNIC